MIKAIVSLSGGMDSATVLAKAVDSGREVYRAVGFCYGSKHNSFENIMAAKLSHHYKVPFTLINLEGIIKGFKSALLLEGGAIPEGHYEADNMKATVVPARNMIFSSILAGIACSVYAQEIWLGIHAGDHIIYPDCRPVFFHAMNDAVIYGTDGQCKLQAPFLENSKREILAEGLGLKVPFEITRTCYKNQELACGKCGSCVERLEAFKFNNVKDPIPYEEQSCQTE